MKSARHAAQVLTLRRRGGSGCPRAAACCRAWACCSAGSCATSSSCSSSSARSACSLAVGTAGGADSLVVGTAGGESGAACGPSPRAPGVGAIAAQVGGGARSLLGAHATAWLAAGQREGPGRGLSIQSATGSPSNTTAVGGVFSTHDPSKGGAEGEEISLRGSLSVLAGVGELGGARVDGRCHLPCMVPVLFGGGSVLARRRRLARRANCWKPREAVRAELKRACNVFDTASICGHG